MQNEDLEVADPEDGAALESELAAILRDLSSGNSKLARSLAHRRAKYIYEQLHPETRHGGDRRPEQVVKNTTWPAYAKYAADRIGLSPSTIRKAIALNEKLANLDERAEEAIFGTALANQIAFVKRIAQLPDPAAQRDVVQIFDASGKKSAKEALAQYEEKAGLTRAAADMPPHVDEEGGEQAAEGASEAPPIDEPESEESTQLALVCQALAVSTPEEAIEKIDALKAENLTLRQEHTLMRERFQAAMTVSANDPVIAPRMLEIIPQTPALRFLLQ
jgi:hypothetical protein